MNEKKSKRLRQLVRHLQEKGMTPLKEWIAYSETPKEYQKPAINANGKLTYMPAMGGSSVLDPGCGRAIYRKMKERADRNGKGV